jgi:hypothetical protein
MPPGREGKFIHIQIGSSGSVDKFALTVHIRNPQDFRKLGGAPIRIALIRKFPQGMIVFSPYHNIKGSFGPVEGILRLRGHMRPHRHGFAVG